MTETPTTAGKNEPHLAAPDVNPSFTKSAFLGEIREELVFPFPVLSDDEKESLRRDPRLDAGLGEASVDSAKFDRDGRFPDEVRQGMHELGLMGLSIPEEYGGFGASAKVYNRFSASSARSIPALAVYFGAHQSIGCKGIMLFGTEEQKRDICRSARRRVDRGVLSDGAGLGLRCAGDALDGGAERRRHALRAQRHEDLDLERGLRGHPHGVREGAGRGRRRAKGARDRVHRRRARDGRDARQARREDGHQGVGHARHIRSRTCAFPSKTGWATSARVSASRSRS